MCYVKKLDFHLSKNAYSGASTQRVSSNSWQGELKEEDIVHHLFEDIDIEEQESMPTNHGMEEATNHHIFILDYVFLKLFTYLVTFIISTIAVNTRKFF
jgi:hypothetical protein